MKARIWRRKSSNEVKLPCLSYLRPRIQCFSTFADIALVVQEVWPCTTSRPCWMSRSTPFPFSAHLASNVLLLIPAVILVQIDVIRPQALETGVNHPAWYCSSLTFSIQSTVLPSSFS
ncbi:hypothetical protein Krac_3033 [Ktedonobacter racemifer DSM 44963]|uniref:Uncharacterized protein n=1 Tax=Ktedonobacter racemifer DSM 44963 TaxID=485913 RepID=D6U0A3_KTERA|nr:hypothetical protein Krac_3033 [Ktedonobacter racemifer DSM 44963]